MSPTFEQKRSIITKTERLLSGRESVDWPSLKIGRVSLRHLALELEEGPVRIYELDHLGLVEAGHSRTRRYLYLENGTIAGVIEAVLAADLTAEELRDSVQFQIDNQLTAASDADYRRLEAVLDNGFEEAPPVEVNHG
jgi:hypothetical protein